LRGRNFVTDSIAPLGNAVNELMLRSSVGSFSQELASVRTVGLTDIGA
jgi:hypothetical protein